MTTPEAPRPGAWLRPAPPSDPGAAPTGTTAATPADDDDLAARLAQLPVAEHADVLAAEHDRLHRLLGTVDQL